MPAFQVRVDRTMWEYMIVTVLATDAEEAEEAAFEMVTTGRLSDDAEWGLKHDAWESHVLEDAQRTDDALTDEVPHT
jgi:hypothetical protein